ncbi:MAG: hypothetical protein DRK00_09510 [Thermoprotei archaeon]|nr:MAG: hypothetical protein DRK00_09510 [Thermoprotei archaeon]
MDWKGLIPPQYLVAMRRFKGVVLDPPDFKPGSWVGAGRVFYDSFFEEYVMAVRMRRAPPLRGYEVRVYAGDDGERFSHRSTLTKEEISSDLSEEILSVEGVQVLRDPVTCKLYLYISVDNGRGWETVLYASDDPAGPWECRGYVLRRGAEYDSREARDPVIDVVDGTYFMLYRASSGERVNTALAVSADGVKWRKLGVPKVDGRAQPRYLQLCGTILTGARGPIFVGLARRHVVSGCGLARNFEAYVLDYRCLNFETIARLEWKPMSPYERSDYPTHGYCSIAFDAEEGRALIYVESLDPISEPGWKSQVDRWILYEVEMPWYGERLQRMKRG